MDTGEESEQWQKNVVGIVTHLDFMRSASSSTTVFLVDWSETTAVSPSTNSQTKMTALIAQTT